MPGSAGRSYRLCSESFPFQTDCFAICNLFSTHHRTDTQRAPWGMISRALDHTRMANCTSSANQRRSDVKKRRERTSSQKNRKFTCPSTVYLCQVFWVCIDSFQNGTRAENAEIALGFFAAGVTVPALLCNSEGKAVFTYPCSFLLGVSILLPGTSFKTVGWSKSDLFFL